MSIVCTVYMREGIIMAADSRFTRSKDKEDADGKKVIERYATTDNARKIMLLKKSPVGISFFGSASIEGELIPDYIRKFEINEVEENDTPEAVANKLAKHKEKFKGTCFFVCGYSKDEPFVYQVNVDGNIRKNASEKDVIYNTLFGGADEAIGKILTGGAPMKVDYSMPLKDGIEYAEFLIDFTIKYQKFSDQHKTCGGPIDILVLTKGQVFWYRNKFNNKQDM